MPPEQWKKGKAEVVITKKNPTVAVELQNGRVIHVYPCSDLLGHVYTGDYIESVGGQKVLTTADLTSAITGKVPGKVVIEYRRDEHCIYNLTPLPSTKPGIELFEITLTWRSGGTPVGLLIHRDFSGRVVVAMVESGSTASKVIRPGDYLIKVNQKEVADREVARKAIMESINASKKVTMTLERQRLEITAATSMMAPPTVPSTPTSKNTSDYTPTTYGPPPGMVVKTEAKAAPINRNLDAQLPADVLDIMAKNKDFFKVNPPAPCLKKLREPAAARLDISQEKAEEIAIPMDASQKPLKNTPKRLGS